MTQTLERVGAICLLDRESTCLPEFFSNDASDRCRVHTLARPAHMFPKRLIDHRLIAPTFGVGAFAVDEPTFKKIAAASMPTRRRAAP